MFKILLVVLLFVSECGATGEFVSTIQNYSTDDKLIEQLEAIQDGESKKKAGDYISLYAPTQTLKDRKNFLQSVGNLNVVIGAAEFVARTNFAKAQQIAFDTEYLQRAIRLMELLVNDEKYVSLTVSDDCINSIDSLLKGAKRLLQQRRFVKSALVYVAKSQFVAY